MLGARSGQTSSRYRNNFARSKTTARWPRSLISKIPFVRLRSSAAIGKNARMALPSGVTRSRRRSRLGHCRRRPISRSPRSSGPSRHISGLSNWTPLRHRGSNRALNWIWQMANGAGWGCPTAQRPITRCHGRVKRPQMAGWNNQTGSRIGQNTYFKCAR